MCIRDRDSVYIAARIVENDRQVSVNEEITYFNNTNSSLEKIKLLNWISAYRNRNTPLLKRKLEDRKSELYFAKSSELGSVENFKKNTISFIKTSLYLRIAL